MANTGNVIVTERDINPFSPTYNTTRDRTYEDLTRCPKETPTWVVTSRSCELDSNNIDTGYMVIVETDINTASSTYGSTKTTRILSADCWADIDGNMKTYVYGYSGYVGQPSNPPRYETVACGHQAGTAPATRLVESEMPQRHDNWVGRTAWVGICTQTLAANCFANEHYITIHIPSTVTEINSGAFQYCEYLTTINIPNSITEIPENCFNNCLALTTITLPESITLIGDYAFGQSGLTTLTCQATTPPTIVWSTFYGTQNLSTIYVPSESVQTYKTTSGWSTYADLIQPIPS